MTTHVSFITTESPPRTGVGFYEVNVPRYLSGSCVVDLHHVEPGPRLAGRYPLSIAPAIRPLPTGQVWHFSMTHLARAMLRPWAMAQRTPWVVTLHDLGALFCPEDRSPGALGMPVSHFVTFYLALLTMRRAQTVIVQSQFNKRVLEGALRWPGSRVRVVKPAPSLPDFPNREDANRRVADALGVRRRPGEVAVLTVGTERPRKRLADVVKAIAQLQNAGRDVTLWHVGEFRALASAGSAGVSDLPAIQWRHFRGITDEDLAALYAAADIYVCASAYEGFSLPTLDAMAAGLPAVVARSTALPELVGPAGVLFEPRSVSGLASALDPLVTDERERARLGALARSRAAAFSWTKCAEETLHCYEDVIAGRTSPPYRTDHYRADEHRDGQPFSSLPTGETPKGGG